MAVNVAASNRDVMLVNPARGADDVTTTGVIVLDVRLELR
jgi:hypothetical protein